MDIRKIISIIEDSNKERKLTRNAFIYLDHRGEQFAQCGTCQMFMPGKERCSIFRKDDKVVANASCGLYVKGNPHDDQKIINSITPEDAGYVLGQVRCENCTWFNSNKKTCGLFKLLNKSDPGAFDMDPKVDPKGCCNGWQSKK